MKKFPVYKTVATADLLPYARNSRVHSDKQIDKIVASIREFGFLNPVIIDCGNGILAGHGRVMAAQKIGMKEVPVIEAGHLSQQQRRAYVIADNRIALESEWNDEILALEIAEIGECGFDVSLVGFEQQELSKLFDETKGIHIVDEDDDAPDEMELIIKFRAIDKANIINTIDAAISEFIGATIWVNDEQIQREKD